MAFSFFSDLLSPTSYKLPTAPTVDISGEQLANVQSNAASFSAAKDLAAQYNDFMAQSVAKRLAQSFPQFEGLQSSGAAQIARMLSGQLTSSDAAMSQQASAAKNLGLGTFGSPRGAATNVFDLARTQQQQVTQGLAALPGFTQTVLGAKAAPLFDFSNTFMSPQQRIGISMQNAENQWNVANLKAQMDVQPEPWMKALAGLGDTAMNVGGILGSRYIAGTGFGGAGFSQSQGSPGGMGGSPMTGDFAGGTGGFGTSPAGAVSESGYSF